jgi:hypothetical protein
MLYLQLLNLPASLGSYARHWWRLRGSRAGGFVLAAAVGARPPPPDVRVVAWALLLSIGAAWAAPYATFDAMPVSADCRCTAVE